MVAHHFENLAACHLLKWCFFLQDTEGRDVDRREVDFVVTEDARPVLFIECKQKDKSVSRELRYLKVRFPKVATVQLYQGEGADRIDRDGIRICPAHRFFTELV